MIYTSNDALRRRADEIDMANWEADKADQKARQKKMMKAADAFPEDYLEDIRTCAVNASFAIGELVSAIHDFRAEFCLVGGCYAKSEPWQAKANEAMSVCDTIAYEAELLADAEDAEDADAAKEAQS